MPANDQDESRLALSESEVTLRPTKTQRLVAWIGERPKVQDAIGNSIFVGQILFMPVVLPMALGLGIMMWMHSVYDNAPSEKFTLAEVFSSQEISPQDSDPVALAVGALPEAQALTVTNMDSWETNNGDTYVGLDTADSEGTGNYALECSIIQGNTTCIVPTSNED